MLVDNKTALKNKKAVIPVFISLPNFADVLREQSTLIQKVLGSHLVNQAPPPPPQPPPPPLPTQATAIHRGWKGMMMLYQSVCLAFIDYFQSGWR
jgi:hypothetical protein